MSTSRPRKPAYHHGDLRDSFLRAASELLETAGIERLSLRDVARRAGVSHNAPYRHYPSRDALLTALAARAFERFGAELAAAEREGGLRARGEAYVGFALANPQHFRLMFGSGVSSAGDANLREQAARAFGGLQEEISAHAGKEVPHAAIAAWALVHGLSHLLLDRKLAGAGRETPRDPAQLREFVSAVLGSVRFSVAQRSA
jgi:AcrR family transcriptional regulator